MKILNFHCSPQKSACRLRNFMQTSDKRQRRTHCKWQRWLPFVKTNNKTLVKYTSKFVKVTMLTVPTTLSLPQTTNHSHFGNCGFGA